MDQPLWFVQVLQCIADAVIEGKGGEVVRVTEEDEAQTQEEAEAEISEDDVEDEE